MPSLRGLDRGEKPALVVSECQNGMVDPSLTTNAGLARHVAERRILPRIGSLAALCRQAGIPVVHCTIVARPRFEGFKSTCVLLAQVKKSGVLERGKKHAEIHPELMPDPRDIVVERAHGLTGFHGTELEPILRGFDVETVILTGVSTNVALYGMSIEAVNRGFNVVIPEDCTAGGTPESHEFQVRFHLPLVATLATYEAVTDILRKTWVAA